ncbi:IclR family transcriptional regulator domain-containing protein [Georgenia ruanii]|uniref:Helix-turn-helix domain-containing protein n=1 Tax=Georgenia ruanii TaxID=348442 RepID=A0A7J9UW45_9MICO|nr:IclR family transcriptional regulator C-terminal domain-containing protein [Georgenia ruanii]MPV88712.1 helix-turn-helix domain-containing protein [Georgenia ruanii]
MNTTARGLQVSPDDAADETPGRSTGYVQSLDRGLAVIRAFDAEHAQLTLSDVARRTGLTRAAARRFLHTLVEIGYVEADGRLFSLRPRVLELGYAYLSSISLPELCRMHLQRLAAQVGESVSVSVLDGSEIVYVARVASNRIMSVDLGVGARLPAYATSMGRVLLAGLPAAEVDAHLGELRPLTRYTLTAVEDLLAELATVRAQGWALVDEELEEGLRSIAAPIRDRDGRVVAACNMSTAARRGPASALVSDLLPHLLATAAAISDDLSALR